MESPLVRNQGCWKPIKLYTKNTKIVSDSWNSLLVRPNYIFPFVFLQIYLLLVQHFHAKDESQDIMNALCYITVSQQTVFYIWFCIWSWKSYFRDFWWHRQTLIIIAIHACKIIIMFLHHFVVVFVFIIFAMCYLLYVNWIIAIFNFWTVIDIQSISTW